MATIKPFAALRPIPELVSKIAELPYDVMSTSEAREMLKANPLSFIQVTRAEADLPESIKEDDARVYAKAAENLQAYIDNGQMKQDPTPCYYIYRQQMGAYIQIGLVAAASLKDYETGIIKKHELTRANKEKDRVNHILATKAQTGPVFLAYRSKGVLNALLLDYMGNHTPVYNFTGDDGVRHTLYVISEPLTIQKVTELFRQIPALYIADGHHRCEAAYKVAKKLGARPHQTGEEAYNYVLSVIFPAHMLHILPYNRVVRDLNGLTDETLLAKLSEKFTISQAERPVQPAKVHEFGMYVGGRWYVLTAKEKIVHDDPIEGLDVSILQNEVLKPVLGIKDPRKDSRIEFVGGIKGIQALQDAVDCGDYAVAFALYPTSMDQLIAVADSGRTMPPKSTWFEPKLRDALTIHLIGDEQNGKSL
ncbi:MAG: DUF1015 family protein [Acidaminococcus sp.]|jgi:uncharacterized protein (DUF1015 family)|nr:DUF1015 family protein [Acidaminococcus sp.]MCI2100628.1 DUF1015 family protein [Acidaminococcus sp.]MCI2114949.1 DUF1015 family protein [Acidaminococcus sp.]MCI2116975.1 DUF1015 family protein [Acidaminococcus sp.]